MYHSLGENYKSKFTITLHKGWGIEGVIGSEHRLDATYISPHIDIGVKLVGLCDEYKLPIILDDTIYDLFGSDVKKLLRKIDVILINETKIPFNLFTFDIMRESIKVAEDHIIGDIVIPDDSEGVDIEKYKDDIEYLFGIDADITNFSNGAEELNEYYSNAIGDYLKGSWDIASDFYKECLSKYPSDGPTELIYNFMDSYENKAPPTWKGFRNIDDDSQDTINVEIQKNQAESKEEKKEAKNLVKKQLAIIEETLNEDDSSESKSRLNNTSNAKNIEEINKEIPKI